MKKIIVLCLAIFMAFSLVACGGGKVSDNGGNGGNGGGGGSSIVTPGGDGGSVEDKEVALNRTKSKFGANFEIFITVDSIGSSTIIRVGDSCLEKMGIMETLYHNGADYFRMGESSLFRLNEEIEDYDIENIVWNGTMIATTLLSYVGFEFDIGAGWTSASTTLIGRPVTKYTLASVGSIYVDNETGATFKAELVGYAAVGNFEVTSFTQGSADLSDYIGKIDK